MELGRKQNNDLEQNKTNWTKQEQNRQDLEQNKAVGTKMMEFGTKQKQIGHGTKYTTKQDLDSEENRSCEEN